MTVTAIAGTFVVLLGFDLDQTACPGLMGFAIHRSDGARRESRYLGRNLPKAPCPR